MLKEIRIAKEKDCPKMLELLEYICNLHSGIRPDLFTLRDRLRSLFGAAGVKQQYIRDRVTNVWQLGGYWLQTG